MSKYKLKQKLYLLTSRNKKMRDQYIYIDEEQFIEGRYHCLRNNVTVIFVDGYERLLVDYQRQHLVQSKLTPTLHDGKRVFIDEDGRLLSDIITCKKNATLPKFKNGDTLDYRLENLVFDEEENVPAMRQLKVKKEIMKKKTPDVINYLKTIINRLDKLEEQISRQSDRIDDIASKIHKVSLVKRNGLRKVVENNYRIDGDIISVHIDDVVVKFTKTDKSILILRKYEIEMCEFSYKAYRGDPISVYHDMPNRLVGDLSNIDNYAASFEYVYEAPAINNNDVIFRLAEVLYTVYHKTGGSSATNCNGDILDNRIENICILPRIHPSLKGTPKKFINNIWVDGIDFVFKYEKDGVTLCEMILNSVGIERSMLMLSVAILARYRAGKIFKELEMSRDFVLMTMNKYSFLPDGLIYDSFDFIVELNAIDKETEKYCEQSLCDNIKMEMELFKNKHPFITQDAIKKIMG